MFLVTVSKLNESNDEMQGFFTVHDDRSCWIINQIRNTSKDNMIFKEIINMLSIISSWVLVFMPSKVSIQSAPGYTFASTWIVFPLRDKFGFIPNLPVRICETTMGRLSLREIAMIFPIHFLVPTTAYWILQTITSSAIEPIVYSEKYVMDALLREVVVNALFTVGLLVIPELLRINGIRRGYALLLLYPLYSFSVDANGKGSVFGPNTIYSLQWINQHEEVPLTQLPHLIGPIVGGLIGGRIMQIAFPDDK